MMSLEIIWGMNIVASVITIVGIRGRQGSRHGLVVLFDHSAF